MKKFFALIFFLIYANMAFSQHYAGLYFSTDLIPSNKPWGTMETGNFVKDHNFSMGYTVGFQGLLMEARRFAFAFGLQYNYRTTYQENVGAPNGCATGFDFENYVPSRLDETLHSIEMPLTVRYNVLKDRKLQPYVSLGFVVSFPLVYKATLTSNTGDLIAESLEDNYKKRLDGLLEMGVGLNYKMKNYIFSIEPHIRPMETQGNFGLALSVLRKF